LSFSARGLIQGGSPWDNVLAWQLFFQSCNQQPASTLFEQNMKETRF
jgi:hypothetical protein